MLPSINTWEAERRGASLTPLGVRAVSNSLLEHHQSDEMALTVGTAPMLEGSSLLGRMPWGACPVTDAIWERAPLGV
jgi:hypothetical protein